MNSCRPSTSQVNRGYINAGIKSMVNKDNRDCSMLKRFGTIFKLNHFVPARSSDLAGFVKE